MPLENFQIFVAVFGMICHVSLFQGIKYVCNQKTLILNPKREN